MLLFFAATGEPPAVVAVEKGIAALQAPILILVR